MSTEPPPSTLIFYTNQNKVGVFWVRLGYVRIGREPCRVRGAQNVLKKGSGALSGKMLRVRIVENNKIDAYFRAGLVK